jgi:hypothetical protein
MRMRFVLPTAALIMSASLLGTSAALARGAEADGNSDAPPPPLVLVTPRFVAVPGSTVMYAPSVAFNLFMFHGRFYSFHRGAWFAAKSHRGPWREVAMERVPFAVRAVPVAYYKIPARSSRVSR